MAIYTEKGLSPKHLQKGKNWPLPIAWPSSSVTNRSATQPIPSPTPSSLRNWPKGSAKTKSSNWSAEQAEWGSPGTKFWYRSVFMGWVLYRWARGCRFGISAKIGSGDWGGPRHWVKNMVHGWLARERRRVCGSWDGLFALKENHIKVSKSSHLFVEFASFLFILLSCQIFQTIFCKFYILFLKRYLLRISLVLK